MKKSVLALGLLCFSLYSMEQNELVTENITSILYSPTGAQLVTGSKGGVTTRWNTETKLKVCQKQTSTRPIKVISVKQLPKFYHADSYTHVLYNPIDSSERATVMVADASLTLSKKSSSSKLTFGGPEQSTVWSIAYSADGKKLAIGTGINVNNILILDPATEKIVETLTGHQGLISCLAFRPNGGELASSSADKTVRLWDLREPSACTVLTGHEEVVSCVACSPDRYEVASGSLDTNVRIWDLRNPTNLLVIKFHEDSVVDVAYSPTGKQLATATENISRFSDRT